MEEILIAPSIEQSAARSRERLKDFLAATVATGAAVLAFGFLFNRATVLSYSIGYNLYGAERVLAGEVPYRDFHTLYPPATLYLNAALFKLFGTSRYSAMLGVLAFRVLTILMLYVAGRQIMSRSWAMAAALLSLLWLRPNGAFKAVPMQYGALFLALALFLLLKRESRHKTVYILLAGIALALLTLFKHNIGAFALVGYFAFIILERGSLRKHEGDTKSFQKALIIASGFSAVIIPVLLYMQAPGALAPMIRTLLFGPGEFFASRLALPRSPIVPALFALSLAGFTYGAYKLRSRRAVASCIWAALIIAISVFILRTSEVAVNKLIFYLPVMIFAIGFLVSVLNRRIAVRKRRALFIVLFFAAAAFLELFPRFAREQSIAAMPFAISLMLHLLYIYRPAIRRFAGGSLQSRLAIAVLPLALLLIGGRLLFMTYFDSAFRFKSDTQLNGERGRGVYFPEATAKEIDEITSYIQQRVPADGYIFAQSNSGSPYLFLANRKNPSTAQFWGGVGVTPAERAATLEEIDRRQVKLIITSDEIVAEEKYEPLRDYINRNFKSAARYKDVLILER